MAQDLGQTGVMRVNDQWATSIQYEVERDGDRIHSVDMRFMQSSAELWRTTLTREQALETLGERNVTEIEKQMGDADVRDGKVKGELSGERLTYREVSLDGARAQDNTVEEVASRGALAVGAAERDPAAMPEHIAARFLRDGDKYYFADQTLAFVDLGSKLRAQTENRAVIKDLVEIAQARGWNEGVVRGTENFRREVWKEAYACGIHIDGYTPSPVELQAAQRDRERRVGPKEAAGSREGDGSRSPEGAQRGGIRKPLSPADAVVYGTLIEHGEAPYKFDRHNSPSYFMRLQGKDGRTRDYWGVGLPEALRQSQTQATQGDVVGIRQVGARPVTVTEQVIDQQNGVFVTKPVNVLRKEWVVEKAPYFVDPDRLTRDLDARHQKRSIETNPQMQDELSRQAVRNAQITREQLQRRSPEVARAVLSTTHAGEELADAFRKAGLISANDREEVIRIFEAKVAEREARGQALNLGGRELNRQIARAVSQAADEVGRTPAVTPPEKMAQKVRSLDAHAR